VARMKGLPQKAPQGPGGGAYNHIEEGAPSFRIFGPIEPHRYCRYCPLLPASFRTSGR